MEDFDLAILDTEVLDGSGSQSYTSNIGVKDGVISRITNDRISASVEISAKNLCACPGFIDVHSHSDMVPFCDSETKSKVSGERVLQGITTEVVGNCGYSAAPHNSKKAALFKEYYQIVSHFEVKISWESFEEYVKRVSEYGTMTNLAPLVGHGNIRLAVMGMDSRAATQSERGSMAELLRDCLASGAYGLSTGLLYTPGSFADSLELQALCGAVSSEGGILTSHLRNYSSHLQESIAEMISLAKGASIPLQISHNMATGQAQWGSASMTLSTLDNARKLGVDVTFDQYPYTAGMTYLGAVLPPWMHEGGKQMLRSRLSSEVERNKAKLHMREGLGSWESISRDIGWENIVIGYSKDNPSLIGRSLKSISSGKDPADVAMDIIANESEPTMIIIHMMSEDDVITLMRSNLQMFGTDGIATPGTTHPRTLSSYPRIFRRYVIEKGILSWEEAVKKCTHLPALRFSIEDRGLLREGFAADIVLFDKKEIRDVGTYEDPMLHPKGIKHVFVNGQAVVENGEKKDKLPGMVLRRSKRQ